jgi:TATA-binding protein-associated factor
LLFENLILEEQAEIRNVSFTALSAAMHEVSDGGSLEHAAGSGLKDWYEIIMTSPGTPLAATLFEESRKTTGHNVDKAMMEGDMSLVTMDTFLATRMVAARALGLYRSLSHDSVCSICPIDGVVSADISG